MAYKTVLENSNNYLKSSELQEGASIEGYLLGTEESKFGFNIKLLTANNKVLSVTPHGNLKKIEEEVDNGEIVPFLLTRITRTGSYTSKTQVDPKTKEFRIVPTFKVDQDADSSITEADAKVALASDAAANNEEGGNSSAAPASSGSRFSNKRR